jgi:hypothetical protein
MNLTIDMPASSVSDSPSEETQRELTERIVASAPFRRSARLRDFLLYVVRQSLLDPRAELGEQEIGEKVFGRSAAYDKSQDNIVRVNATELRRRVDQYFLTEGAHEAWVLSIPRGGYKPVFQHRNVPEALPAVAGFPEPLHEHQELPPEHHAEVAADARSLGWLHTLWGVVTVLLVLLSVFLWRQNRLMQPASKPAASGPELSSFWGGFAQSGQLTDIVLPDDSASVVEDITHESISLQDYLRNEYMQKIRDSNLSNDRKMDLAELASHDLITFGDVKAARQVLEEVPASPPAHLTLARYYNVDAMKRNNTILIGGRKANPWVHLFDDRMNFILDYDYSAGHGVVLNLHPRPGEQAIYTTPSSPDALTCYSVIAYLPNPSQNGRVIILAGMDADSTSAAAEFITSETQMARFRQRLKAKQIPYFEALLRTSRVKGTSFNAEIVAYRTYSELN